MKRFLLLLVCATMMVAANAQTSKKFISASADMKIASKTSMKYQLSKTQMPVQNMLETPTVPQAPVKDLTSKKAPKKTANSDAFEGNWIDEYTEDMTSYLDRTYQVATSNEAYVAEDEEGEYVVFENALDGYATELFGIYDAEAGTFTIPAQYCYEHESYGKFAFYAVAEDGENLEQEYVMDVTTDDNGNLILSSEQEWVLLMTEGDYEGYPWSSAVGLVMYKANYLFDGYECHIENRAWTDYYESETYVYVESIEDELFIHGMFGTTISMAYNPETNYYELPNGQDVTYGYTGTDYIPFTTYNMNTEDGAWEVPQEEDYTPKADFTVNAYISDADWLVFGTTTGKEVDWDYIYVANFTSANGGYFKNLWAAMTCEPLETTETGITTAVTATTKDNVTYNLAGQQVSKNFKGIVVKNGRKFINK